jgi:hypothetical protein
LDDTRGALSIGKNQLASYIATFLRERPSLDDIWRCFASFNSLMRTRDIASANDWACKRLVVDIKKQSSMDRYFTPNKWKRVSQELGQFSIDPTPDAVWLMT